MDFRGLVFGYGLMVVVGLIMYVKERGLRLQKVSTTKKGRRDKNETDQDYYRYTSRLKERMD